MTRSRLNDVEARLLGVLIEKELTTPEQYPLSLNALRVGSNQKSNREPVVSYSEPEVWVGIQGLESKGLAERQRPGLGSRVEHYKHLALERLHIERDESAVLAELLLRGAQAPGELRQRASRMHDLDTLASLSFVLDKLLAKKLIRRLAPGQGSRVERFTQTLEEGGVEVGLLGESVETVIAKHDGELSTLAVEEAAPGSGAAATTAASSLRPPTAGAIRPVAPEGPNPAALEARIARLERQLARLADRLGEELGE